MTVGMSAPPIGMISSTPKASAQHRQDRDDPGLRRVEHQHHHERDGHAEDREVDRVLARVDDRPLRQPLLQLPGGHQAAREDQEPEHDLDARARPW